MVKKWDESHPEAIIPKKTTLKGVDEENRKTPKGYKHRTEAEIVAA